MKYLTQKGFHDEGAYLRLQKYYEKKCNQQFEELQIANQKLNLYALLTPKGK